VPKYQAACQDGGNNLLFKDWLICTLIVIYIGTQSSWAQTSNFSAAAGLAQPNIQDCRPGARISDRQRCDEAISEQLKAASRTTALDGGWRLVKTKDPFGNSETVSAMRTVDADKSDINLAGLSLNCVSGGIQIALIVLSPIPRTSHPKVILTAGSNRSEFEGAVTQSGEALLLPPAVTSLAARDWENVPELSIEITTKSNPIRGILPLGGLSSALRSLSRNCAIK
jgi:hypothetical protein